VMFQGISNITQNFFKEDLIFIGANKDY